jgi:hypothetical protein
MMPPPGMGMQGGMMPPPPYGSPQSGCCPCANSQQYAQEMMHPPMGMMTPPMGMMPPPMGMMPPPMGMGMPGMGMMAMPNGMPSYGAPGMMPYPGMH